MPVQETSGRSSPHSVLKRFFPRGFPYVDRLLGPGAALPHVAGLLLRAYLAFQFVALEFGPSPGRLAPGDLSQQQDSFDVLFSLLATGMITAVNLVFSICLLLAVLPRLASAALFATHCAILFLCPGLWNLSHLAALQERLYWSSYLLALIACGPGKLTLPALLRRLQRKGSC